MIIINTDAQLFKNKEHLRNISISRIWWNEERCKVRFSGYSDSKIGEIEEGDILEVVSIASGSYDDYNHGTLLFTLTVGKIIRSYMFNLNPLSSDLLEALIIYKTAYAETDLKVRFNVKSK